MGEGSAGTGHDQIGIISYMLLCHVVLYATLYYSIPYYTYTNSAMLYYIMSYHSCHSVLYYNVTLCYIILHYSYNVPYYVILLYGLLYYILRFILYYNYNTLDDDIIIL